MSTTKPSRRQVLISVLVLQAYTAVAVAYFATGRPIYGGIWGACSVLWVWIVMTSVNTYGNQCTTAAYREMREMRWSRS